MGGEVGELPAQCWGSCGPDAPFVHFTSGLLSGHTDCSGNSRQECFLHVALGCTSFFVRLNASTAAAVALLSLSLRPREVQAEVRDSLQVAAQGLEASVHTGDLAEVAGQLQSRSAMRLSIV